MQRSIRKGCWRVTGDHTRSRVADQMAATDDGGQALARKGSIRNAIMATTATTTRPSSSVREEQKLGGLSWWGDDSGGHTRIRNAERGKMRKVKVSESRRTRNGHDKWWGRRALGSAGSPHALRVGWYVSEPTRRRQASDRTTAWHSSTCCKGWPELFGGRACRIPSLKGKVWKATSELVRLIFCFRFCFDSFMFNWVRDAIEKVNNLSIQDAKVHFFLFHSFNLYV